MTSLSLAMIVRNEEATITGVLQDAAAFCDELVVVDTGSTDRTVELARAAGARVEHFTWIDDFAAARNAAFGHCTGDWLIWLDADDRVVPEVQQRLRALKTEVGPHLDAVYLPYRYHYSDDGAVCTWSFPRERLVRREAGLRWSGPVHEILTVPDQSRALHLEDAWVEHRPLPTAKAAKTGRNLSILRTAYEAGDRTPRTLFYFANELADNQLPEEAISRFEDFLAVAPLGWERHAALLSLARAQKQLDREQDALESIHDAIREDPLRAEAFVLAGLTHFEQQRWAQAIPYFMAATTLSPPADGFVAMRDYAFMPWDYLSVCYFQLGRQREAWDALGKGIEGNPDQDRLLDNARWILQKWMQR